MNKTGLIVEGGGLRGLFASGVLDVFMDYNIEFPYINAVSYGSVNVFSYLSGQRGRTKRIADNYINDPRYMGFRNLIKEGNYFGTDFTYRRLPEELDPFDMETFKKSNTIFNITATNCETGKPEYFEKASLNDKTLIDALRASASLPLISRMVKIENSKYLDGGLSDSIPIKKAMRDGYDKNIIILTRDRDYRKKSSKSAKLIKLFYRKYPKIAETVENRYRTYNETLDYIDQLEKDGKAMVIRPIEKLTVGRLEKDLIKLDEVYRHGINVAEVNLKKIKSFLSKK